MMIDARKFNPGHLDFAMRAGFLNSADERVETAEFARRAFDLGRLNAFFDLLGNHQRHQLTHLADARTQLQIVEDAIQTAHTRETLNQLTMQVNAVENISVAEASEQTLVVVDCIAQVEKLVTQRPRKIPGEFSDEVIGGLKYANASIHETRAANQQVKRLIQQIRIRIQERGSSIS